jgi:hypothetical protein
MQDVRRIGLERCNSASGQGKTSNALRVPGAGGKGEQVSEWVWLLENSYDMIRKRKRKSWERDIASRYYRETRQAFFSELEALKALSDRAQAQSLIAAKQLTVAQKRFAKARENYVRATEKAKA